MLLKDNLKYQTIIFSYTCYLVISNNFQKTSYKNIIFSSIQIDLKIKIPKKIEILILKDKLQTKF